MTILMWRKGKLGHLLLKLLGEKEARIAVIKSENLSQLWNECKPNIIIIHFTY